MEWHTWLEWRNCSDQKIADHNNYKVLLLFFRKYKPKKPKIEINLEIHDDIQSPTQ